MIILLTSGVWALDKSTDNGQTWKPWQYFAGNDVECQKYFGVHAFQRGERIERDDQVICSTSFSKVSNSIYLMFKYNNLMKVISLIIDNLCILVQVRLRS